MLLLLLLALSIPASLGEQEPIVETVNGIIKGIHRTSYDGNTFSSFEGIPFAKPPVGELRFKEPKPMTPWTGNEDCLYLNVYVPRKQPNGTENLDVIAFIHGGAFMSGASHFTTGPEYLMDRDLIFVSFNYRLGPLGFLSFQDEELSGNLGLRDQTLALKWIQANIAKFGGNPKSVTLTGMSAGGSSVHFHYVSPQSKGLFHRGFSQSGTILQPWAFQKVPVDNAKKMAALTGCYDESSANMVKCLRQRSAEEILAAVAHFYEENMPLDPFGPTVERVRVLDKAFLPNHPYYLVNRGIVNDVPWIISVTTDEGLIPALLYADKLDYLDKNWDRISPYLLDFNFTTNPSQKKLLPVKIKERYFMNKSISKDTWRNLVQLLSDRLFVIEAEKAARAQAEAAKSPVYFLVVGFKGQHSLTGLLSREPVEGVSHGDDAYFYLYPGFPNSKLSDSAEKMKNLYLDMLVEYSRTGVPKMGNTEWIPVSTEKKLSHLLIKDPEDIEMKQVDELGATEFWQWAGLRENENVVIFGKKKEEQEPEKRDEL